LAFDFHHGVAGNEAGSVPLINLKVQGSNNIFSIKEDGLLTNFLLFSQKTWKHYNSQFSKFIYIYILNILLGLCDIVKLLSGLCDWGSGDRFIH